jgi:sulfite reductase (NADPH) flavoprotein alpha-component
MMYVYVASFAVDRADRPSPTGEPRLSGIRGRETISAMPVALLTEPNPANRDARSAAAPPEAADAAFAAPIAANYPLTGVRSSAEKRHVEVDLAGSGLDYAPGDALAILPRNDPRQVEALIECLGLAGGTPAPDGVAETSLTDALTTAFEIGVASPRFLKHWAALSGSPALRALTLPEATEARRDFLRANHVIDIVRAFPVGGLAAGTVLAGLRPLQPRLYSMASSPAQTPGHAAITTSTLVYELHGELRCGVVSGFQVPAASPGSSLPIRIEPQDFRLPADDAAIIMVGAGTGIAPFRAFIGERRARGASGRSWLVMGARTARDDFIYRSDWERALADGYLGRLDLAFSRDTAEKVYVQDRLREHGAAVFAWLEDGASLYVCGDAAGMGPAVHAALIETIEAHGRYSHEDAMAYVRRLAREHRYQRSIY